MKGIQLCSNEGPGPFTREDNFEIVKTQVSNVAHGPFVWFLFFRHFRVVYYEYQFEFYLE